MPRPFALTYEAQQAKEKGGVMKLIVYASGMIEEQPIIDDELIHHYNLTTEQAKVFTIVAVKTGEDEPIVRADFIKPDGATHTEIVYPHCLAGDRDKTSDDAGGLAFDKGSGPVKVPNYIMINDGAHRYAIRTKHSDGTEQYREIQINVGESNWFEDPDAAPEEPVKCPLLLPVDIYISRDKRVSGIPLEKVDAFIEELKTLYQKYEHRALDDEDLDEVTPAQ